MKRNVLSMPWILSFLILVISTLGLHAQPYPNHVIRIVVPFPPGATTDALGRLISIKMADDWKTSVIVENKAGASGLLGADYVAKSKPDGYTVIIVTDAHISLPNMFKSVPFDPVKSFTPIMMLGRAPNVFVVNPSQPFHTIKELIDFAREHPGQLAYGSAGPGGSNHMTAELFKIQAKVQIRHIPFKGGAPNALGVVANQVPMAVSLLPTIEPFVRAGKVRALAITSAKRNPALPDVPTLAESGFPGFEAYEWWALLGPAELPKDIVDKLNAEVSKIMAMPDVKEKVQKLGVDYSGGGTPEQTKDYMQSEMEKWYKVAKTAGIKPD